MISPLKLYSQETDPGAVLKHPEIFEVTANNENESTSRSLPGATGITHIELFVSQMIFILTPLP